MTSKQNVKDNNYGYNTSYGFYLTSKNHQYEKDILRVGGYEKTQCWVDKQNKLIGILFSKANKTIEQIAFSSKMEIDFKKELYRQLNKK